MLSDDHNEHSGLKESTRINCNGIASSPNNRDGGGGGQFVRTRIRTSFDPELELPKLHKWFAENQHPSRTQIHLYVKELNSLESRRGRKPLDINNVVYWFKNARAAHKRQELKFTNGSPLKDGGVGTGVNCSSSPSSKELNHSSLGHIVEGNGNNSICLTTGTLGSNSGGGGSGGGSSGGVTGLTGFGNTVRGVTGIRSRQGPIRDEEDDDEGESGQEDEEEDLATETDDNSSQLSHTLDLSMRAIKKNQGSTANSPPDLACGTTSSNNSDSRCPSDHEAIKEEDEEMPSDEDEDGDSDRDSYEKYYQTSSVTAVAAAVATAGHMAATFYGSNNNSANSLLGNNGTGNGLPLIPLAMNGSSTTALPSGGLTGSGSTPACPSSLATSGLFTLGSTATSTAPELLDGGDARRSIRRSRTFIDPMSEVPRLEQWFTLNTHPTHSQIVKYTDELNQLPYRQKFPKLEPKNIQFWFKNRRAKYKRLNLPCSASGNSSSTSTHSNCNLQSNSVTVNSISNNSTAVASSPVSSSTSTTSFTPPSTNVTSTSSSSLNNTVTASINASPSCSSSTSSSSSSSSIALSGLTTAATSISPSSNSSSQVVTSALNIERLIGH